MASLTPSIIATTTLNNPFLHKTPHIACSKNRIRSSCRKISFKTNNNNNNYDHLNLHQNTTSTPLLFDRRNMLLGLGGLYGSSVSLTGNGPADTLAAPIAPDVYTCSPTDAQWDGSVGAQCCPPNFDPSQLTEFKFENYPNPVMKVRKPAHLVMNDQQWLSDYKKATAMLMSPSLLPMNDPRSFMQQAMVHCAYCDGAYPVVGFPDTRLEVHTTWLFASFHRWYLYFFERILGKMIGNPGFALPYWNWDHPDGMRIPEMFKDVESPLYDPKRNPDHLSKVIDLAYNKSSTESDYSDQKQIQENLLLMRKQMLYVRTPELFFGAKYVAGDIGQFVSKNAGTLERSPHNNVHIWTGQKIDGGQDMGAFWSAARDPIFYCHHANVDRMWDIWRKDLPGPGRIDLNESDYLDAYFIFYDENAKPVKVYVKDSFDSGKLGYTYQEQPLLWTEPLRPDSMMALFALPRASKLKISKPKDKVSLSSFPMPLKKKPLRTLVPRPRESGTGTEDEKLKEEVLVIYFELGMFQQYIQFDVYVNDDSEYKPGEKTEITLNYAGSFTRLSHREGAIGMKMNGRKKAKSESVLKLGITNLLDDIDTSEDEFIQVTIVPRTGTESVVITKIDIEFIA